MLVFSAVSTSSATARSASSALAIADAKSGLGFGRPWRSGSCAMRSSASRSGSRYSARSVTDKILAIIFPISAFVAAGFEHSVANMYFLPIGARDQGVGLGLVLRHQRAARPTTSQT